MNIRTLYQSGRFPHAVLLLGGDCSEVLQMYKCDPADTVYVKEAMPGTSDSERAYKIKPLREIIASGNLRPQFGDMRVFVFNEFDLMSEICQNALLKFIEESHEFNRFVMTAESTAKILPTILSRIVVIRSNDHKSEPVNEIAREIVSALVQKDEYSAAAAFSRVKDRLLLGEVLQALLKELLEAKLINATDIIKKYQKRTEVNPNISMTVTSCTAELFKEINS
jgi:DNA polymerase III delta prime subunit